MHGVVLLTVYFEMHMVRIAKSYVCAYVHNADRNYTTRVTCTDHLAPKASETFQIKMIIAHNLFGFGHDD